MNLIPALALDAPFWQSFFVIAREGLEAILILAAVVAYLRASHHERRLATVYWGAGLAVLASLVTAYFVEQVFAWQEAQLELLEGITMLFAAGVLLYVSYWLIDKARPLRWQAFIRGKVDDALTGGGGYALGAVAFIAVYREGFEVVLFYKALLVSMPEAYASLAGGFLAGLAVLALAFVLIIKYSVRLPVREFFIATGALLFVLALVFAGKGVHELQEAGVLPEHAIGGVPKTRDLGIYPTLETLGLQAFVVALSALAFFSRSRQVQAPARG